MRTSMPSNGRPSYVSIRQAAWIFSVEPSQISRAIRLGQLRTVRRHDQLVIPTSALVKLLGRPVEVSDWSGVMP